MKENKKENKKDNKKINKRVKITFICICVAVLLVIGMAVYVMTPYRASERVAQYFDGTVTTAMGEIATDSTSDDTVQDLHPVTVTEQDNRLIVAQPDEAVAGLIFYPGGRVDYDAYVPLAYTFAQRGITCIIVKMPLDFAVFKINAANGIREQFPEIDRWFIGGHSLGGAMAASYVAKHTEDFEGLVLLGAYSTADLSNSGLKVFTAYGTQDGVINRRSYSRNLANLPQGSQELIIIGGCHAFFGDYGSQFGDGHPYITCEQQMQYTVDGFVRMILNN